MIEIFCPDLYVKSIGDINLEWLRGKGIWGLILDLDNTLVSRDKKNTPSEVMDWIGEVTDRGFSICILSNSLRRRVTRFAEEMGVPFISKAAKPRKRAFLQAMETMGLESSSVAVVGDQLLTDILGGNRMDLFTVLVQPKSGGDFITTWFARKIEGFIMWRLERKQLLRPPQQDP